MILFRLNVQNWQIPEDSVFVVARAGENGGNMHCFGCNENVIELDIGGCTIL